MIKRKLRLQINDRVTVDGVPGRVVGFKDVNTPLIALSSGYFKGIRTVFENAKIKKVK